MGLAVTLGDALALVENNTFPLYRSSALDVKEARAEEEVRWLVDDVGLDYAKKSPGHSQIHGNGVVALQFRTERVGSDSREIVKEEVHGPGQAEAKVVERECTDSEVE